MAKKPVLRCGGLKLLNPLNPKGLGLGFRVEAYILGKWFFGYLVRLQHMVQKIEGFKILT